MPDDLTVDTVEVLELLADRVRSGGSYGGASSRLGDRRVLECLEYAARTVCGNLRRESFPDLGRSLYWDALLATVAGISGCRVQSWGEGHKMRIACQRDSGIVTVNAIDRPGQEDAVVALLRDKLGYPPAVCACGEPISPLALGICPGCARRLGARLLGAQLPAETVQVVFPPAPPLLP